MSSISYISCFPKITILEFEADLLKGILPFHTRKLLPSLRGSCLEPMMSSPIANTWFLSSGDNLLRLLSSICIVWTTLSPSASTLETREEGRGGSLTCSWWGQVSTFSLNLGSKPGQPGQNSVGMRLITCLLYHCDRVSRILVLSLNVVN